MAGSWRKSISVLLLSIAALSTLAGCAPGSPFHRADVQDPGKAEGRFDLMIMRELVGPYLTRVSVLDLRGDDITIIPGVSKKFLDRFENVSLSEAIRKSVAQFKLHCAYTGYKVNSLRTEGGAIAGYEIIPEFTPFLCEIAPQVTVNYYAHGEGKVKAYLKVEFPIVHSSFINNPDD